MGVPGPDFRALAEKHVAKRGEMEHIELRTNSVPKLMRFVNSCIQDLVHFRLDIVQNRDKAYVAELISTEPEPEIV
jgi:hypothetical protein